MCLFADTSSDTLPPATQLLGKQPAKPPVVKVTCASLQQLRQVQAEVAAVLTRYPGAYLSVSAGAL